VERRGRTADYDRRDRFRRRTAIRRNSSLAILALLAASRLTADGLSPQFKDWAKSPEAYFLTAEEKTQWKNVKDDGQAREFVERYYARRAPDLPQILKERIGVADKYFSAGKVKGSETLRGEVIILFGPPSELQQNAGEGSMGRAGTVDRGSVTDGVPDPHGNIGPGTAGLVVSEKKPVFTFVYDAAHAPKTIGKAFRVELTMKTEPKGSSVTRKSRCFMRLAKVP
jgi:GWxTD domain-containing protein